MMRVKLAPLLARRALRHLHHQVKDPELRARLTPDLPARLQAHPRLQRLPPGADASPTSRSSREGINEVRGRTVVGTDGSEREVDTIIFGTGFHVTDMPTDRSHRAASDGRTLAEHWDGRPQAYRGTAVAGFPNLFFLLGPNTGLGHTSVVVMVEAQVQYVVEGAQALRPQRRRTRSRSAPRRRSAGTRHPGGDEGHGLDPGRVLELVPRLERA